MLRQWLSLFLALFVSLTSFAKEITFIKKQLQIGNRKIEVEIADTPDKQSQGLMFRKSLKDGEGMLFVFDNEDVRSFWMKNTFIDLDIGYFDRNKTLKSVVAMAAVKSEMETNLPSYPSVGPAQYALEVPKGWFQKNKIKIGEKFKLH